MLTTAGATSASAYGVLMRADVGEGADLLGDSHGVGERPLLPGAEQLRRPVALAAVEDETDVPAVELEALGEVLGQRLERLTHRLA